MVCHRSQGHCQQSQMQVKAEKMRTKKKVSTEFTVKELTDYHRRKGLMKNLVGVSGWRGK